MYIAVTDEQFKYKGDNAYCMKERLSKNILYIFFLIFVCKKR